MARCLSFWHRGGMEPGQVPYPGARGPRGDIRCAGQAPEQVAPAGGIADHGGGTTI
jgi:hypothetical protein